MSTYSKVFVQRQYSACK